MENIDDISINIIQEESNIKKIKVTSEYYQDKTTYDCNENERIKDLLCNFINDIEIGKDLKDAFLLYNGNIIDDKNKTFNQIIKSYEENINILVSFNGDNMNLSSINSIDSVDFISINKDEEKTINTHNTCDTFLIILQTFIIGFCCIGDIFCIEGNFNDNYSFRIFFILKNRTLFYPNFIIGIVNYIDYYHDWNKKFIESTASIIITFFINSFIVAILWLGIIINMIKKDEKKKKIKKEKEKEKKEKENEKVKEKVKDKEKEKEKENHIGDKIILYIYTFLYIPIIIFYCFLLVSFVKKDYILCITSIVIAINFIFLVSSMLFARDEFNIFLFFLSFFFKIICIFLVLIFIFIYWDEVIEGKIGIIIITIVYFLYRLICPLLSLAIDVEYGYEVGVVTIIYIILLPIAILMYCLILIIFFVLIGPLASR